MDNHPKKMNTYPCKDWDIYPKYKILLRALTELNPVLTTILHFSFGAFPNQIPTAATTPGPHLKIIFYLKTCTPSCKVVLFEPRAGCCPSPFCGSCWARCRWSPCRWCSDHGRNCWQRPPCHWWAALGGRARGRSQSWSHLHQEEKSGRAEHTEKFWVKSVMEIKKIYGMFTRRSWHG